MDTIESIRSRRSIRKFKNTKISRDDINEIIEISLEAPSGKNTQPWTCYAVDGERKIELESIIENAIDYVEDLGVKTYSAKNTLKAIRESSTLVLIYNNSTNSKHLDSSSKYKFMVDLQSIGGMIQTMLLAAEEKGYGTLWICDTFYAEKAINTWLNTEYEMVAAVAIGEKNQTPPRRPREELKDVLNWI